MLIQKPHAARSMPLSSAGVSIVLQIAGGWLLESPFAGVSCLMVLHMLQLCFNRNNISTTSDAAV